MLDERKARPPEAQNPILAAALDRLDWFWDPELKAYGMLLRLGDRSINVRVTHEMAENVGFDVLQDRYDAALERLSRPARSRWVPIADALEALAAGQTVRPRGTVSEAFHAKIVMVGAVSVLLDDGDGWDRGALAQGWEVLVPGPTGPGVASPRSV